MKIAFMILGAALAVSPAYAEEYCVKGVDPIDCLTSMVETWLPMCQRIAYAEYELAEVSGGTEQSTTHKECIAKGRADVQALYSKALPSARRNKTDSALKEYAAMSLAAFSGISPAPNESKLGYRQRQAAALQALRVQGERAKLK